MAAGAARQTILVVDDSSVVRKVTRNMLEQFGYQVVSAEDGPAALTASREFSGPIHLLLTDVVMPGMNGPELADRVLASRPDTRVLFMSGVVTATDLEAGKPFLAKPYGQLDLLRKVEEVLPPSNPWPVALSGTPS
jgi:two-component system, cell cycle sensor histidine kinase and response regulator CckA